MEPEGARKPKAMGAHHFMGHRGPHKVPDHMPEMIGPAGGLGAGPGGEPEPDADDMAPGAGSAGAGPVGGGGAMGGGGSPPGY